jgi:uncharacterized protein YcbK (DUF882 family)
LPSARLQQFLDTRFRPYRIEKSPCRVEHRSSLGNNTEITYRSAGRTLRDHRTGEVRHFDPHLFDLLYDLIASLNDAGGEIDVICGYRTPWSNEFLRTRSAHTAVALHSLHMQAEAIDIRLPGIPTSAVRDAALRLQRGGVGYYRDSNFIHVDVGRVRRW